MKHPPRRFAASAAVLAAAALALVGCAPDPGMRPSTLTGIVYSGHAYNPTVDREGFLEILEATVTWGTYLVVMSDESEPRELFADVIEYDQSAQKVTESRGAALGAVADEVVGSVATSPESDPLEAILRIAGAFEGQEGERQIVVLSNLLQTHGAVDLSQGALYAESTEIIVPLVESGYLDGQLAETRVVLGAAGQVDAGTAQPVPDSLSRRLLIDLWTEILTSQGAEVVRDPVRLVPVTGELPPVTVVPFQDVVEPVGCRLRLGPASVNFRPGSGEFIDASAESTLRAAAADLRAAGCSGEVTVVATTSSAEGVAEQQRVARLRLETVVPIVASELGVDAASIRTVAAGYDERYCAPDRDTTGRLLAGPAAACRQVIVGVGVEL